MWAEKILRILDFTLDIVRSRAYTYNRTMEDRNYNPKEKEQAMKPNKEIAHGILAGRTMILRRRADVLASNLTYKVVDECFGTRRVLAHNLVTGTERFYHVSRDGVFREDRLPITCNPWAK